MSQQQQQQPDSEATAAAGVAAATSFGSATARMESRSSEQTQVHGKYVQLFNIVSDDEDASSDYVLEDVSKKTFPISYARVFHVGPNRPPVDYYWFCVLAIAVQTILAPYMYFLELGCGANLALRSMQNCRWSRSYFARGEFELAALTAFKAGRHAGAAVLLSVLTAALASAFILAVVLVRPEHETLLDFHVESYQKRA